MATQDPQASDDTDASPVQPASTPDSTRHARLVMTARVDSLADARAATAQVLRTWGLDRLVDDAVLVVDELASNVAEHVGGDAQIDLIANDDMLRIAVMDTEPDFHVHGLDPNIDRNGLRIVDSLVDRWGVHPIEGQLTGKVVWAEIDLSRAG